MVSRNAVKKQYHKQYNKQHKQYNKYQAITQQTRISTAGNKSNSDCRSTARP